MNRKTEVLSAVGPEASDLAVRRAIEVLRDGGLVAFPTETVYGVGALASDADAVRRLYQAKGRSAEKAIPVLIADLDQLRQVAVDPSPAAVRLARRFWPGPLTLVLRRQPGLPQAISETATVGVRIPNHPLALALLGAAGPMAVTSANRSGGPSRQTAGDVFEDLSGRIELILDGGRSPGGQPSTVVAVLGDRPEILRQGPIPLAEIVMVWFSERSQPG